MIMSHTGVKGGQILRKVKGGCSIGHFWPQMGIHVLGKGSWKNEKLESS